MSFLCIDFDIQNIYFLVYACLGREVKNGAIPEGTDDSLQLFLRVYDHKTVVYKAAIDVWLTMMTMMTTTTTAAQSQ